ncbi:MAG: GNAT family N-acetyltransferase [Candidatus Hodarchaeales archaeon]|jgi:GNAT superfamily N-acetyltransferase
MTNFAKLSIHPLTPDRWEDLVTLFGKSGAYGNCWCMWFRLTNKEFNTAGGSKKKQMLKDIVDSGVPPGLLGYLNDEPIAWISLGSREDFKRLERSRNLKPIDDKKVWSIVCFFIHKNYRKRGYSKQLINEALRYAEANNATIIESYPVDTKGKRKDDGSMYYGHTGTFISLGFIEIVRRNPTRPIMRYSIKK